MYSLMFLYKVTMDSDMDIDGPTFVPKSGLFTNLGQRWSQKVDFS